MPKAARKKKLKQKDFQKAKLKVGKVKPNQNNVTDTSFQTKTILLPNQQAIQRTQGLEKEVQVLTSRNLTLKDILNQLKHHSSSTRKDALIGLSELLERDSGLYRHVGQIVARLAPMQIDVDGDVRRQAVSCWKDLLTTMPMKALLPFGNLIMAHTALAMTHLMEEVRLDSTKFLNCFLELCPDLVLQFETNRILANFLGLLGAQGDADALAVNPTSKFGSNKVRVAVLSSLATLLSKMTRVNEVSTLEIPTLSNDTPRNVYPMAHPLSIPLELPTKTPTLASSDRISITLPEVSQKSTSNFVSYDMHDPESFDKFLQHMIGLLVDVWLEAFPSMDTDVINADFATCLQVMQLLAMLFRHRLTLSSQNSWIPDKWAKIEKHLLSNFPFTGRGRDGQTKLSNINLASVDLVANVTPQTQVSSNVLKKTTEYLVSRLDEEGEEDLMRISLSLLASESNPTLLLKKVLKWDGNCESPASKLELLNWLQNHFSDSSETWLSMLPRFLWLLGETDEKSSLELIRGLARILRTKPVSLETRQRIQLGMVPYLHVDIPNGEVWGPFLECGVELQRQVLNLILDASGCNLEGKMVKALVVVGNVAKLEILGHLVMLLQECGLGGEIKSDTVLSILLSLLLGYTSDELKQGVIQGKDLRERRNAHSLVIPAIEACLQHLGKKVDLVVPLLKPHLKDYKVPMDAKIGIYSLFEAYGFEDDSLLEEGVGLMIESGEPIPWIFETFAQVDIIKHAFKNVEPSVDGFHQILSCLEGLDGPWQVAQTWKQWISENESHLDDHYLNVFKRKL